MISDFLALENLILTRLSSTEAGISASILTSADLAGVAEGAQPTPAVHVLYDGYTPQFEAGSGALQQIEQRWLTVVAVRNVRRIRTGASAREAAGPLIMAVLLALTGWRASDDFTALRLAAAPDPVISQGYGYFPLAWTTQFEAEV